MTYWAPFLLVAVTAILLVLPVTPALHELQKRRDASALPTSRHDGKIVNFAESFHSKLEPCRGELEICRTKREIKRTRLDGIELLLVGSRDFDFEPEQMQNVDAVVAAETVSIPPRRIVDADLWSYGDLHIGEGAVLRAGLSSGNIVLAPNSAVLRWLHAHGSVYLQRGSIAHNRLSAERSILLEPGCAFQRLHAPVILSRNSDPEGKGPLLTASSSTVLPDLQQIFSGTDDQIPEQEQLFSARPRMRIQGDFVLPPGESLRANVITTGEFRLGRGACFFGSVKSYRNTVLEDGASIRGSVACGGTAYLGAGSFLSGPLMAENAVYLSNGSCVGRQNSPTTVAACTVQLSVEGRVHGTIWARVQGIVEG